MSDFVERHIPATADKDERDFYRDRWEKARSRGVTADELMRIVVEIEQVIWLVEFNCYVDDKSEPEFVAGMRNYALDCRQRIVTLTGVASFLRMSAKDIQLGLEMADYQ